MEPDEEGFLYPVTDVDLCNSCGLCRRVCPTHVRPADSREQQGVSAYGLKHRVNDVLAASSSGGAFTALAEWVVSAGGTVYGAAFDEGFKVIHVRAEQDADLARCRGSKYSQSELGDSYALVKSDLLSGRTVLFSGTPCQVAGLRAYLRAVDTERLLLTDFVCHGVPSPLLFQEFVALLQERMNAALVKYEHRCKDEGWTHKEKATFADGRSRFDEPLVDIWKLLFYSNLALRPSCYTCPFASPARTGDITLADFWGVEKLLPAFADSRGVSLVLVNTSMGAGALDAVSSSLSLAECDLDGASALQPLLRAPVARPAAREEFWTQHATLDFERLCASWGFYGGRQRAKGWVKGALKRAGLYDSLQHARQLLGRIR